MKELKNMDGKLLVRYLSQEASPGEISAVEKWRKASPDHEDLFDQYKRIWNKEHYQTFLSNEEKDQDWCAIRRRLGFGKEKSVVLAPDSVWMAFVRIAAVVVLMLAVSGALWTYWNVPGYGRWTAFKTAGYVDSLMLPDNSMVFLNQYSSLTYRNNFGDDERNVSLRGEGYFEVTSDVVHPFHVNAGDDLDVEVVGTCFHIKTPGKVRDFELNVTEGTVLFSHNKLSKSVNAGNLATVTQAGIQVKPIESTNFISWKTGEIELVSQSLPQIIAILKQHYKEIKEVQLNTSSDVLVTTRFKNQPLSEVLEELEIHFDKKFRFNEGVLIISD
jgi:ferric-dicitrate binding protein FerR (iron transport regulator)